MNDNEDPNKSEQPRFHYFISLIIRGSLDRAQLGPHNESTTYNLFCRWFFLWCQMLAFGL